MNNAMTVDVEDYFQVSAFSKSVKYKTWDKYELRVESNTERLLTLFDKHDVKATFFILGWIAERLPELVTEIHKQGHEVACHGYSHQLIYTQKKAVFRDETKRSKDILENIINSQVYGYRAASYSITNKSLWALNVLAELGFEYDSSIVPIHHDTYGIPGMPRFPYVMTTSKNMELTEFPPSTLSLPGLNVPVAGGGYFRLYPYWFTRLALKWLNLKDKNPFIFYLHPWEIDPDQPKLEGSMFSRFRHYNNLSKCYFRLDRLLNSFSFVSVKDVLNEINICHLDAKNNEKLLDDALMD